MFGSIAEEIWVHLEIVSTSRAVTLIFLWAISNFWNLHEKLLRSTPIPVFITFSWVEGVIMLVFKGGMLAMKGYY